MSSELNIDRMDDGLIRGTEMESATVRQARPGEEAIVSAILNEAAAWLQSRGMPLWKQDELSAEMIAAEVADGLYFLAVCDGVPAGTVRFQLSDPLFWPDMPPEDAAYIHRLAVRREFAGGRVPGLLLNWAAERTAAPGRPFLRLDCDASRLRLRAVYERFGFRYHSDRQVGPYLVARSMNCPLRATDIEYSLTYDVARRQPTMQRSPRAARRDRVGGKVILLTCGGQSMDDADDPRRSSPPSERS